MCVRASERANERTNVIALHFNKFQHKCGSFVQTTFGAFNGFLVEQTFMCVRVFEMFY